jgi:hypothetical protein
MLSRLSRLRLPLWSVPLAAAALGLLCYGLLIPWLGFYWDDLSYQYSLHVFGPAGFGPFVARDRPFSAWIYVVTSSLFGDRPLPYQLLNLALRIACAAALWVLVRALWPGRGARLAWAPLAFMVYPGFWQQPVSFIYNLHWANLCQELLSLACMLLAARAAGRKHLAWSAASLLLMLNVFSLEYAFGLEGLRPLLLFLALGPALPLRARLWTVFKRWLPYLAVNAAFLIWTLVLFNNNLYDPGGRAAAVPLAERALSILRDLFQTGLLPWLALFAPLGTLPLAAAADRLFWLAAAVGGLLAGLYTLRLAGGADDDTEHERRWPAQLALVGLWALVCAGIPVWGVGLNPETRFPYDRFTLPFSVGAALLLAAFLEGLVRGRGRRAALFALFIGLAAGAQFQNTNTFKREWQNLPLFLAQLAWRAPALQPGTLLLTHDLPFKYYSDYSLSGLLNMQYAPGRRGQSAMPYLLLYIGDRVGGSLPALQPGLAVTKNYRSLDFSGSTDQALVFYYSPPACLRLLDPARAHELPDLPAVYAEALPLSRPDLVQPDAQPAAVPPAQWFPAQAETTWCAAFEQAELARQRGDWAAAARLGDQALTRGLAPAEFSELGVFAEAKARLGDSAGALALLQPALADPLTGRPFACREWAYLAAEGLVPAPTSPCGEESALP